MTRKKLYLISALLMIMAVPWLFSTKNPDQIFGFPTWAFWAVIFTVVYCFATAYFLHKYWALSARHDEPEGRAGI